MRLMTWIRGVAAAATALCICAAAALAQSTVDKEAIRICTNGMLYGRQSAATTINGQSFTCGPMTLDEVAQGNWTMTTEVRHRRVLQANKADFVIKFDTIGQSTSRKNLLMAVRFSSLASPGEKTVEFNPAAVDLENLSDWKQVARVLAVTAYQRTVTANGFHIEYFTDVPGGDYRAFVVQDFFADVGTVPDRKKDLEKLALECRTECFLDNQRAAWPGLACVAWTMNRQTRMCYLKKFPGGASGARHLSGDGISGSDD